MRESEAITLNRDCPGIEIPAGSPTTLAKGSTVVITQSLGGTYTVMTERGGLVRISGNDADALGKTIVTDPILQKELTLEERVWEILKTCYDPEIPVNIVELGLIYSCNLLPTDDDHFDVQIEMTLTAPGCGMGPVLQSDIENKLKSLGGVRDAIVQIVFDPPWDYSRMSEAARLQLNF